MNELRIFSNPLFGDVRTIKVDGKPMFCLADVCSALEISKTADVRSRLKADGVVLNDITDRLEENNLRCLFPRVICTELCSRAESLRPKSSLTG